MTAKGYASDDLETPISTTTLDRDELLRRGANHPGEALRGKPGLAGAHGQNPVIRGLKKESVVVMVDGKPKLDKDDKPVMQARYGFHALRHAAASAWIKQRIDLKRLQVWIGHESIQLTLDTYGHLIADATEDAALIAATQAELLA